MGYKFVIEILAVVGLILAFITYIIVPEIEATDNKNTILADIKVVLKNIRVISLFCFAGLMVAR